jgi:acetyl-CoA C-acetyltransferase
MQEAVILSAVRTPIGKFLGALSTLPAPKLGSFVVAEALQRAGVTPDSVDEVIMGNVLSAGLGQNPARQAALGAGLPPSVGAVTVNKVCGSSLKAVMMAAQAVQLGDEQIIVAGGMESMSRAPFLLDRARTGYRLGHGELADSMIKDGLWDAYEDFHMGNTGEIVADEYKVTREEQDRWAVESHQKAVAAVEAGRFADELMAVEIKGRRGDVTRVELDEGPRKATSMESLAKLRPVFKKDGTVTAGNASTINDGAAAVVVTSAAKAKELGREPLVRIVGYATAGLEPRLVMMVPEKAVGRLCEKIGWKLEDVDLFEFNEAFAVQQVALARRMEIPTEKINVNGGAVALGHPIGASGSRVLTTLIHAMRNRKAKKGIASLCLGGGNAVAMAVEAL